MNLHERIDQLLADAFALLGRVQGCGGLPHDYLARHPLHYVERAADHPLVVAYGKHLGHASGRVLQGSQQARLAQHVVGARRQWRRAGGGATPARGAAISLDQVGDVGMPIADRLRSDLSGAEIVLVQEATQRLQDEQGRPRIGLTSAWRSTMSSGATAALICSHATPKGGPGAPRRLARIGDPRGGRRTGAEIQTEHRNIVHTKVS